MEFPAVLEDNANDGLLPDMMNIDGRADELGGDVQEHAVAADDFAPPAGVSAHPEVQDAAPAVPLSVPEPSAVFINSR